MQKDAEQIHGEIVRGNKINCHFGVGYYSAHLFSDKVACHQQHNGDRRYFWDSGADAIRRSSARRPDPSRLPGVGWHVQPWSAHRTGAAHAAAPLLKPQFWISAAQQPVPSRLPGRGWHLQQWLAHRTRAAHASAPLWKMQFWISASQWPVPIQMPVVGWATRVSSSH